MASSWGGGDAGLAGERIDAQYKNGQQIIRQRQAAFEVDQGRVLVLTAATPRGFDESFERLWREWLDSFERPATAAPTAA